VKHSLAKLRDGTVLVAGGYQAAPGKPMTLNVSITAHLFDPRTNTFSRVGNLHTPRVEGFMALLPNGWMLVGGGDNPGSPWKTFEVYNPATRTFQVLLDAHGAPLLSSFDRHDAAAVATPQGVLVAGGDVSGGLNDGLATRGAELVNGSPALLPAGLMAHARSGAGAGLLSTNDVLVAGGQNTPQLYGNATILDSVETWNATTRSWTAAGTLQVSRFMPQVAVRGDQAFVIGGFHDVRQLVNRVEVFNAQTKTLEADSYFLSQARVSFTATTLKDRRILVAGGFTGAATDWEGWDGNLTASTEIFLGP
jgi:hypothetical protein